MSEQRERSSGGGGEAPGWPRVCARRVGELTRRGPRDALRRLRDRHGRDRSCGDAAATGAGVMLRDGIRSMPGRRTGHRHRGHRGAGWTLDVSEGAEGGRARPAASRHAARGTSRRAACTRRWTRPAARRIERNHSATHLRPRRCAARLGEHVRQQGSLVEPTRLRFDFSHHGPVAPGQLDRDRGAR